MNISPTALKNLGSPILAKKQLPRGGFTLCGSLAEEALADPLAQKSQLYWEHSQPNSVDLLIKPEAKECFLSGTGIFHLRHPCVKCLEHADYKVQLNFDCLLVEREEDFTETDALMGAFGENTPEAVCEREVLYFHDKINVGAIVRELLFAELPAHPTCNHPLALPIRDCSFKEELMGSQNIDAPAADPRMAGLKKLFI